MAEPTDARDEPAGRRRADPLLLAGGACFAAAVLAGLKVVAVAIVAPVVLVAVYFGIRRLRRVHGLSQ